MLDVLLLHPDRPHVRAGFLCVFSRLSLIVAGHCLQWGESDSENAKTYTQKQFYRAPRERPACNTRRIAGLYPALSGVTTPLQGSNGEPFRSAAASWYRAGLGCFRALLPGALGVTTLRARVVTGGAS